MNERLPAEVCPKCRNGGKVNVPGRHVCPYDNGSWAYCDCPAGKAIERIEDTSCAEGKPAAVRDAIAAGADLTHVQMPHYTNRPEVMAEIERIRRA